MAKKNKDKTKQKVKGTNMFGRILALVLLVAMLFSTFAALIGALIAK